jgi:hypothetical protein
MRGAVRRDETRDELRGAAENRPWRTPLLRASGYPFKGDMSA